MAKTDRLLDELLRVETQLQEWIKNSESNRQWFNQDPIGAMCAAGLGLEDSILCELKSIAAIIAMKLEANRAGAPAIDFHLN